ncbi:MAG: hypothetical protein JJE39_16915 [Vicinamibacteria bacterium]|nr:hypothetical protein [Vicinamibacteria bacterium]
MADLTLTPSARRFASFLDRESCVWLPSPSVALLSALITGKGRPKRLLVQENAPAFISNIGLVTGAAPVKVNPSDIDEVLETVLRTEGWSLDQVWGVATHGDGTLSPTDWLSTCAASGIPTVELCMGSLFPLARWGTSPAMFTIVDLDAEPAFAGARLTALLTGDRAKAARVQQLCLPGPEAQDYVLDAWPRGLAHDEPALLSLVERATAQGGEKSKAPRTALALAFPWTRRLPSVEGDSSERLDSSKLAPAPPGDDRWRARLEEAEARHAEALRAAEESASSLRSGLDEQRSLAEERQRRLQAAESDAASRAERDALLLSESRKKVEERQRTIDQWETRFREAEKEAEKAAAVLTSARTEILRHSESEQARVSMEAERDALAQKLARTEREHDLAVADAARHEEAESRVRSELRQQVEQFERAAASGVFLSAQVARLEKDAAEFARTRDGLLKQKAEAELALASSEAEKQALALKLADLDAELGEALADAAKRTAEQRAVLAEQVQRAVRLEKEVAALTTRDAAHAREREVSQGMSQRIAGLEAERDSLVNELSALARDREQAFLDAARLDQTQRSAGAEQRARAERVEAEGVALKERETRLTEEWERERAGLSEKIRLAAAESGKARDEALRQKMEADQALASSAAEKQALARKLADLDAELGEALKDGAKRTAEQRAALAEQVQRATRLEADAAALKERETRLTEQWERERAGLSEKLSLLKAEAGLAEKTFTEFRTERITTELALEQARTEAKAASQKLAEAEQGYTKAVAELVKSQAAVPASLGERIARLEADSALADQARKELLAQKEEAERALASAKAERDDQDTRRSELEKDRDRVQAEVARREEAHRAQLEEQGRLVERLKTEAGAAAEREAKQAEAWGAARVDLVAQIARLEAREAVADHARIDLQSRKRDSDQELAAAQDERAALHERDQAQATPARDQVQAAPARDQAEATPARTEGSRQEAPKGGPSLEAGKALSRSAALGGARGGSERNTGGLSALVNLWNTAVIKRPKRNKEIQEKPPEPRVGLVFGLEVIEDEASPLSGPAPRQEVEPQTNSDLPAPAQPGPSPRELAIPARKPQSLTVRPEARPEERRAGVAASEHEKARQRGTAPPDSPDHASARNTGGLGALVNLWNTGVIRRPSRNKETVDKPPDPPVGQVFGLEGTSDEASSSNGPAPIHEQEGQLDSDVPVQTEAAPQELTIPVANPPCGSPSGKA